VIVRERKAPGATRTREIVGEIDRLTEETAIRSAESPILGTTVSETLANVVLRAETVRVGTAMREALAKVVSATVTEIVGIANRDTLTLAVA